MKSINQDHYIEQIIKEFDFNRVRSHMLKVNWEWYTCNIKKSSFKVPTVYQLKKEARRLLNCCIDNDLSSAGCGGLSVEKEKNSVKLSFVVTETQWHDII